MTDDNTMDRDAAATQWCAAFLGKAGVDDVEFITIDEDGRYFEVVCENGSVYRLWPTVVAERLA